MLQKELAKRLKARYDTKMDGSGWLEVSSDGIPLCRIKYNGQFLSNADKNLSDEYRSKFADIQDKISTVREYVRLYEHAPQIKADGVSDYRQLAAKNIAKANYTLLSALYLLTADKRLWGCCKHHNHWLNARTGGFYGVSSHPRYCRRCRMAAFLHSPMAGHRMPWLFASF